MTTKSFQPWQFRILHNQTTWLSEVFTFPLTILYLINRITVFPSGKHQMFWSVHPRFEAVSLMDGCVRAPACRPTAAWAFREAWVVDRAVCAENPSDGSLLLTAPEVLECDFRILPVGNTVNAQISVFSTEWKSTLALGWLMCFGNVFFVFFCKKSGKHAVQLFGSFHQIHHF